MSVTDATGLLRVSDVSAAIFDVSIFFCALDSVIADETAVEMAAVRSAADSPVEEDILGGEKTSGIG